MRYLIVLLQVVLAFVLTASVMPVLLVTVPAAREGRFGLVLSAAAMVIAFVLLRLVWPRRR
jgi:hypothetical protein